MPTKRFDLTAHSDALANSAKAWLLLGLAALVGAGFYSLMLVLARTPGVQDVLPLADFFHVALVVHVNLSVLIWLLSMAGVFWSLSCYNDAPRWDKMSFWLAVLGALVLSLSPFLGADQPLMNNYVPVLQHPLFYSGLGLFAIGILLHLLRCGLDRKHPSSEIVQTDENARLCAGIRLSAWVTALACLSFLASMAGIPTAYSGVAYFELLFWGGGHVLQYTHVLLMMVAWIVLADESGYRFPIAAKSTLGLLVFLAVPLLAVPYLYLSHEVISAEHRQGFTDLMRYGGLFSIPIGIAVVISRRGAGRAVGEQVYLRTALWSSLILFATGGMLGYLIAGLDIVIPAHYHGSTVGVTIAFMGLCYYLLPRLGFGPVSQKLATWQPLLYGGGQLLHIFGLAWSGGYGVQRKTLELSQSFDRLGEIAGLGLMGLGGLISVIGGLVFLIIAWQSIRTSQRSGVAEPAAN